MVLPLAKETLLIKNMPGFELGKRITMNSQRFPSDTVQRHSLLASSWVAAAPRCINCPLFENHLGNTSLRWPLNARTIIYTLSHPSGGCVRDFRVSAVRYGLVTTI